MWKAISAYATGHLDQRLPGRAQVEPLVGVRSPHPLQGFPAHHDAGEHRGVGSLVLAKDNKAPAASFSYLGMIPL